MRRKGLLSFALLVVGIAAAPVSVRLARAETAGGSKEAKTTSASAPVAVDACALLTPQEAAAALGGTIKPPKPSRTIQSSLGPGLPTAVSACTFATGSKDMTLGVRRTADTSAGQLRRMIQVVCQGKEAIPGLGDVACWYSPAHEELQAVKGATFLTVQLRRSGNATEAIKEVARKALARVP